MIWNNIFPLDFAQTGSVYGPDVNKQKGHIFMHDQSINELRQLWAKAWGQQPHLRVGRIMLAKSLAYKLQESLSPEQQLRLDKLVKEYKRNPAYFERRISSLKPGTRLVRIYNNKKHSVLVKETGFDYQGQTYSSLSKIANDITGKRWNGWVFFGLKKAGTS